VTAISRNRPTDVNLRRKGCLDRWLPILFAITLSIAVVGFLVTLWPEYATPMKDEGATSTAPPPLVPADPRVRTVPENGLDASLELHAQGPEAREVSIRFEQAIGMLHLGQYEYALVALHEVLKLAPEMPETHVNMGFALFGLQRNREAWNFFNTATLLRPEQANAHFGMALALEAEDQLAPAIEAMVAYLHLEKQESKHTRLAQAAVWEWQARQGNGPWGETRGVPPGYTEEQIRRNLGDGKHKMLVNPVQSPESQVAPSVAGGSPEKSD